MALLGRDWWIWRNRREMEVGEGGEREREGGERLRVSQGRARRGWVMREGAEFKAKTTYMSDSCGAKVKRGRVQSMQIVSWFGPYCKTL